MWDGYISRDVTRRDTVTVNTNVGSGEEVKVIVGATFDGAKDLVAAAREKFFRDAQANGGTDEGQDAGGRNVSVVMAHKQAHEYADAVRASNWFEGVKVKAETHVVPA